MARGQIVTGILFLGKRGCAPRRSVKRRLRIFPTVPPSLKRGYVSPPIKGNVSLRYLLKRNLPFPEKKDSDPASQIFRALRFLKTELRSCLTKRIIPIKIIHHDITLNKKERCPSKTSAVNPRWMAGIHRKTSGTAKPSHRILARNKPEKSDPRPDIRLKSSFAIY